MFSFAHISLGPLTLNFYGFMYAVGAVAGYFVTVWFAKKRGSDISKEIIADIIFWAMMGGVLGGRVFYVLVYDPSYYLANPLQIPAVWNGGMSIHGGLLGGALALSTILKKKNLSFCETVDLFVPAIALGLLFGRIGNFVNGELPGRVTDVSWGLDFGDGENRHPYPLYAAAKNLTLFGILLILGLRKKLRPGSLTSTFIILLGIFRFFTEFFRQPDPQIGLLAFGLSLGQYLSLGVVLLGIFYFLMTRKKER
jgi:phosphatidylglycerol:prolipoprotein diacylglycerol transferase